MVSLAEVMLLTGGYKNVILVDYGPLCCNYFTMSGTVAPQMGEYLANAIVSIGLRPNLVDIVGYSLGAHVSGYAGATLMSRNQGRLNKIVGELIIIILIVLSYTWTKLKFSIIF